MNFDKILPFLVITGIKFYLFFHFFYVNGKKAHLEERFVFNFVLLSHRDLISTLLGELMTN